MTLRTRLILWLLLMSVVPLGAVTVYTYVSSANALREAAAREADLLAGELSSRMQLVTTELSSRVEQLMNRPEPTPVTRTTTNKATKPVATKPAAPANAAPTADATPTDAAKATADEESVDKQVAQALGDAAMLLNTVELQGVRNLFRGTGGGTVGGRSGGRQSGGGEAPAATTTVGDPSAPRGRGDFGGRGSRFNPADPNRSANPGRPLTPRPRPAPQTSVGGTGTGTAAVPVSPGSSQVTPTQPPAAVAQTPPAPGVIPPATLTPPAGPAAPAAPAAPPVASEDRFVVDLGAMARDLTKRIAPEGLDKLTPEERQRVSREVGMRMMGVAEGLRLGAAEIQKKAEAAKIAAAESAKAAEAKHTTEAPADAPSHTRSTLTGNKLGVVVERGGKVVHSASAEVNLDNLLMTVFSTTRRDQGEVPFAVAKDGKIYTQSAADRKVVESLGDAVKPTAKIGTSMVADWIIVTNTDPSGSGLRFGIARPVGDSLSALRKTAGRNAGLGLLLIGFALVVVVPVSQGLTKNLSTLTDAVGRLAHGDFAARVQVTGGGEVAELATAFNKMAGDIQKQQELLVGQERLKRELELGRQIQSEMLPHESLRFGLTEVKGMSIPAREVGGDFFNYFALENGSIALLVGDVSGKGVGAALLMANFQAALRTRLTLGHDLASIADAIDRDVAATAPRGLYTTLFVGIFDPLTKRLRYVNAGHNPQFVLRKGAFERLSSTGTPIGLLPGRGYSQQEVQLSSGDFLFFYTDGIVEAENEKGEEFTPERLERLLVETITADPAGPDAVLQRVESAVRAFCGDAEPHDDATSMVVRVG
jgi:serine phosphatase RsbU (regulator of sigma subunit)